MQPNLLSNILIVPDVISQAGTDFILAHAQQQTHTDLSVFDPDRSNATGRTEYAVDKTVRDTQMIDIGDIMPLIVDLYKNTVSNIINPFYEFEIRDSEVPQLLRYGAGGHYQPHVDGQSLWQPPGAEPLIWRKSTDRDISTVFFLNDDFEGGDFVFPDLNIRIRPRAGMLVCFPSTHEYVHGVDPVTSGERYSMVNWMTIKDFPTMADEEQQIATKYKIKPQRKSVISQGAKQ